MQGFKDDFTLHGHQKLVAAILAQGYTLSTFPDAQPDERHLVLRHDVDMSLPAAVTLARAEAEAGYAATYFVLLRTEMYNVHSGAGLSALREILHLGHQIGLHLDASLYEDNIDTLNQGAESECKALEDSLQETVDIISLHRPARALLDYDAPLGGRLHAYQPRFFSGMGYCADSRGEWRYGHPLAHDALTSGRALQMVTHPIWWYREDAEAPPLRTARFFRDRTRLLDLELASNCVVHQPEAPEASA